MMKSFVKKNSSSAASIEMTPLIDIVFQLLLFFILTSAMLQPSLNVDLPQADGQSNNVEADMIISVDNEGTIFINDSPSDLDEVKAAMHALVEKNPAAAVILSGDKAMRYGLFFDILNSARDAGVKNLNLSYDEER
jgi:biopolymer transport protein ExbD